MVEMCSLAYELLVYTVRLNLTLVHHLWFRLDSLEYLYKVAYNSTIYNLITLI